MCGAPRGEVPVDHLPEDDGDAGSEEEDEGEFGAEGFDVRGGITGPDSEEIFSELLERFADRRVVQLHRAALRGDVPTVRAIVQSGVPVDATLLPIVTFGEVRRCNAVSFERILTLIPAADGPYPAVDQFTTGEDGEPNELFPTGAHDEPERNLDAAYQSPLQRAAAFSTPEVVAALIALGANRNFTSPCEVSAVTAALGGSNSPEDMAAIIKLVATPETVNPPPGTEVEEDDCYDRWPLAAAALNEDTNATTLVVHALVECGAKAPEEFLAMLQPDFVPPPVIALLRAAHPEFK